MKAVANNRFLWVVLGIVLVAVLGISALSSQATLAPVPPAASASASASPSASASASNTQNPAPSTAAKPFLSDYQDPTPQAAPNGFLTVASLILKLGVVVGLIYLTVLGLRYFGNRSRTAFLGNSAINVIEKTALAQNRELYLVDVADRVLLLGATTTSIALLTEITDPDAIDDLRTKPQPALPSAEPFLNYLKKVGEHARPIAAEVAAAATSKPSQLLKPADLIKRIDEHKQRIRERTASLQGGDAALGNDGLLALSPAVSHGEQE